VLEALELWYHRKTRISLPFIHKTPKEHARTIASADDCASLLTSWIGGAPLRTYVDTRNRFELTDSNDLSSSQPVCNFLPFGLERATICHTR
jgi:hypothetical protein